MSNADIPEFTPGLVPEWAPQCATMLVWPHKDTDWGSCSQALLSDINNTYITLTNTIRRYQPVLIICKDHIHKKQIGQQFAENRPPTSSNLNLLLYIVAPYNDTWCRDYAPLAVYRPLGTQNRQTLELLDFRFNGWGGKYNAKDDDALCKALNQQGAFKKAITSIKFALEGGSIDSNGEGLMLTTEACLLSGTRNKGFSRADIEQQLAMHLHCKKILWLSKGSLIGDDTDSHVDNLARFVNANTIVYASCDSPKDAHYQPLLAMARELKQINQDCNLGLNLIPIPIPRPLTDETTGDRLPASYINFIMINGAIVVPTFDVAEDTFALTTFASLFPDREILAISARHLIRQFGGPHCATMQLPVGTLDIKAIQTIQTAQAKQVATQIEPPNPAQEG